MKLLRGLLLSFGLFLTVQAGAAPVLRIALSDNKPPYTIASPVGGIEYDLVRQIVLGMGMTPDIQFLPNARAQAMLRSGEIDAAIGNKGDGLSQPFIAYENVAISLKSKGIILGSVSDLASHSVAAFQNAHLFLGADFAKMAASSENYREASPQVLLNRMLFGGRVEVIVSDWNIFNELKTLVGEGIDTTQAVTAHRLFAPTRYGLNFANLAYRDAFNASLLKVLAQDPYPALAARYNPTGGEATFRP